MVFAVVEFFLGKNMNNQAIYKVSGRSMEADSLFQGDFVIVDKEVPVVNHDIVVISLSDKSLLIKHLYRKGKHLFFYPFSKDPPAEKTYRPLDEAVIEGKVVAIICNHKKKHSRKD